MHTYSTRISHATQWFALHGRNTCTQQASLMTHSPSLTHILTPSLTHPPHTLLQSGQTGLGMSLGSGYVGELV